MTRLLFDTGDFVTLDSCSYRGRGQIQTVRHAVGNHRTGDLSLGCDVLRGDGKVQFYFLHDVARWNPDRLAALSQDAREHDT
jgi:hypothetical protein